MKIGDIANGLEKLSSLLTDFEGRKGASELMRFSEFLKQYESLTVAAFTAHVSKLENQPPTQRAASFDENRVADWVSRLNSFDPVSESIPSIVTEIGRDANKNEVNEIARRVANRSGRTKTAGLDILMSHFTTLRSSRQRTGAI